MGVLPKVGMITFHSAYNYGAILQTTALYHVLKSKCGVTPEIINYTGKAIVLADVIRFFPVSTVPKAFFAGLCTFPERYNKRKKYRIFFRRFLCATERFNSKRQLRRKCPSYPIVLCGSDQIWNPNLTLGVEKPYFLNWGLSETVIKASYAASFGVDKLPVLAGKKIGALLKDLNYISVRESSGIEIVNQLADKDAVCCLDPTLLLTDKEWEAFALPVEIQKPYILIYQMQNNPQIYKTAALLKQKYGLYVVDINNYGYRQSMVDEALTEIGPGEFIGLFRDAAYVCTNSYHGLIFSLIFGKPAFIHAGKRWNSRINYLLNLVGASQKLIVPEKITADNFMDYCLVPKQKATGIQVKTERENSIQYLRMVVGAGNFDNR